MCRLPWQQIDTVLLDMDGTLLDLHFDHDLWMNCVPQQLVAKHGIGLVQAHEQVNQAYNNVAGKLDWYCIDYWQQQLQLDILALHVQNQDKIAMRSDCLPFLQQLKQLNKRRILTTNAHPQNLALKLKCTDLEQHLDEVVSSHQYGAAKEDPEFWQALFAEFQLDPKRCLFIDDSEAILLASQQAGVAYQLGITTPDSQKPKKQFNHFQAIDNFHQLEF
ncbi:GMP/IMP nucleotidase [Shewanella marina]|uniref:GMP/IMP nucleotidase n=1 Tax=Shewanella marina TaxID=487319 RepID=UPI00046EF869|nr:GMP/IMP nucleotidase [Shewanella marina]